jgi:Tol biopolymer transport system component
MRPTNRTPRRAVAAAAAALVALAATAHAATPGHNGSIVFMRFAGAKEDGRTAQLFVRTPSGAERQITHVSGGAFDPAWSPDGTQIVFVRYLLPFVNVRGEELPSAADLMLVPAAGGAPQVLRHFAGDPLPGHPEWSPDGKQLVLPLSTATQPTKQSVTLDALNVLDIASGSLRAITPLSLGAGDPDWSPDGTRIVFSSEAGHSQFAYVVRPDGTGLRKIAHKARNNSRRKDDRRFVDARTQRPRWSPDGRKIVFTSDMKPCGSRHIDGCPRGPERLAVFVMNSDGSGAHRLTRGARVESSPSWAPAR